MRLVGGGGRVECVKESETESVVDVGWDLWWEGEAAMGEC